MSQSPPHPARTRALLRAEICGLGITMAAVLFGRPDLLILAAPLLLYAAWAELARPKQLPFSAPNGEQRVAIGDQVDLTVLSSETAIVAIARPPQPGLISAEGSSQSAVGLRQTTIRITMQSWGKKIVGPLLIITADLLGAWRATTQVQGPTLLASPAPRTIKAESSVNSPIGTVGRHPARRAGDGSQLSGIRPYQPGDRASRINWRATSRTSQLHSNQTLMERDTQVQIVMDTSFIAGAPGRPDTVDLTCEAVSTLAHHYAWLGDRVSLVDLVARIPSLPFGTGRRHARRVLEVLSHLDRTAPAARPQQPFIRPGTLTFLCSPLVTPEALRVLAALRLAGAELAIVDTFPSDLRQSHDPLSTALRIRSLQRRDTLERLRRQGIPVATWVNEASLLPLLNTLAASRGPRRTRQ